MQAGRLKYRLRLLMPIISASEFGSAAKKEYKEVATVYAERVKFSGQRREEAGAPFADYRAEFNVHYSDKVKAGWRAEQLGGHNYMVVSTVPNLDRGMLTLICERVNE